MNSVQAQQTLTPRQVIVAIAGRQWSCLLHSSGTDMTSYYAQPSIPAYTGFVMDFGSDQQFVSGGINPDAFGFNPDAVLFSSTGQIAQIVRSVKTQPRPVLLNGIARYVISVNAGEMNGISFGSVVTMTEAGAGTGFDISTLLVGIMPLIMLIMVMGVVTSLTKNTVKAKD